MKNGSSFYGFQLPLGENLGGPLFFSHYSFLGLDPRGLSDAYANYETQTTNHSKINHAYCKANPRQHYGYSDQCWGLTASDNNSGYSAHSPNNDLGVISPTAALSSMPYTPTESMKAARFFYYKLGDKIWRTQGFTDAFNLNVGWFATSFLAIDQGPIVVMIENHRSQLLWKTFTSDTEVKAGLKSSNSRPPTCNFTMAQTCYKHINHPGTPKQPLARITPKLFQAIAPALCCSEAVAKFKRFQPHRPTPSKIASSWILSKNKPFNTSGNLPTPPLDWPANAATSPTIMATKWSPPADQAWALWRSSWVWNADG